MSDENNRFLTARLLNNQNELVDLLSESVSVLTIEQMSVSTLPSGALIVHSRDTAILIE